MSLKRNYKKKYCDVRLKWNITININKTNNGERTTGGSNVAFAVDKRSFSGKCNYCGIVGHKFKQCWKRTSVNKNGTSRFGSDSNPNMQRRNDSNWRFKGKHFQVNDNNNRSSNVAERADDKCILGGNICFSVDTNVVDNVDVRDKNKLIMYVDYGCTNHMVKSDVWFFSSYMKFDKPLDIATAGEGHKFSAVGVVNICAETMVNGKSGDITIKNVFHVPGLRKNLLSVKRYEVGYSK